MKTYCVSCKKKTSDKNSSVRRTKQNSLILVSNRAIYCKKNQGSLKIKEQAGYWTKLGIEAPLIDDILF